MIRITGNTFPVKDQLKGLGGQWSPAEKCWLVPENRADSEGNRVGMRRQYYCRGCTLLLDNLRRCQNLRGCQKMKNQVDLTEIRAHIQSALWAAQDLLKGIPMVLTGVSDPRRRQVKELQGIIKHLKAVMQSDGFK